MHTKPFCATCGLYDCSSFVSCWISWTRHMLTVDVTQLTCIYTETLVWPVDDVFQAFSVWLHYNGYDSNPDAHAPGSQKVTFHSVPCDDQELLTKWIRANPRQNWKPIQRIPKSVPFIFRQAISKTQEHQTATVSRWRKKKEAVSKIPQERSDTVSIPTRSKLSVDSKATAEGDNISHCIASRHMSVVHREWIS